MGMADRMKLFLGGRPTEASPLARELLRPSRANALQFHGDGDQNEDYDPLWDPLVPLLDDEEW